MLHLLRTSLPRVFEEMERDYPWLSTIGVGPLADAELSSYTLPFVLLFPRYGKFAVVTSESVLNGDAFYRYKGRRGASVAESVFYIGMC